MASIFVYKMLTMPPLTKFQLCRIDTIITTFLWKGKKAKIPLKVLCGPETMGGLKLVDFQAKYDSLMMSWVTKLQEKDP